jgi:hypothetical protein
MKKLLFFLTILPFWGLSQPVANLSTGRTIGKITRLGETYASLIEFISSDDTSYIITYKYKENGHISVKQMPLKNWQTVNALYLAIRDSFGKKSQEESTYNIAGSTLVIKFMRSLGYKYIIIYNSDGSDLSFDQKEMPKLFNSK